MADKELSGLATAGAITGTELIHVVQSGNSRQTTTQKIIDPLAEPLGKLRLNAQTVSYTLVLGDAGKVIEVNSGSAKVITLPTNASVAFATDTYVKVKRYGAGAVTITGDTGVTLNGTSAGSVTIPNQFGDIVLHKRATNEWTASVPGSGLTLLNSGTLSSQATLDIVLTSYTVYRGLLLKLYNVANATGAPAPWLRVSTDGGSTYDSSSGNYVYTYTTEAGSSTNSSGDTKIVLGASVGSAAPSTSVFTSTIEIFNQSSTSFRPIISFRSISGTTTDGSLGTTGAQSVTGMAQRTTAQDTDAIRFLFSSGNIASGTWALYGYA